jgi:hypothetical protein
MLSIATRFAVAPVDERSTVPGETQPDPHLQSKTHTLLRITPPKLWAIKTRGQVASSAQGNVSILSELMVE